MTLAEEVRRIRTQHKLSLDEFGTMLGVSKQYIYKIENSVTPTISFEFAAKICTAFNLPMDHFVPILAPGLTVPPPPSNTEPVTPLFHYQLLGTVGASKFDKPDVYDPPKIYESHVPYPKGCYALKVTGSSCQSAGIPNGATVVIRPTTELHERRFMVVQSSEGYALKLCSGGQLWQFHPGDAEPSTITLDGSTRVVGYVVGGSFGEPDLDVSDLKPKKKKGKTQLADKPRRTVKPGNPSSAPWYSLRNA